MTQQHPLSEQCPATAKSTGKRCVQPVIGGGPCFKHGGNAPQVKAAREARIIAGMAALQSRGQQSAPDRDPAQMLLDATGEADRIVRRLLDGEDVMSRASLTAVGEWLDRVARLSKLVLDARIDERLARVSEVQGQLIAFCVRRILDDLDLTTEQQQLVPTVVPRALRQMAELEAGNGRVAQLPRQVTR